MRNKNVMISLTFVVSSLSYIYFFQYSLQLALLMQRVFLKIINVLFFSQTGDNLK